MSVNVFLNIVDRLCAKPIERNETNCFTQRRHNDIETYELKLRRDIFNSTPSDTLIVSVDLFMLFFFFLLQTYFYFSKCEISNKY